MELYRRIDARVEDMVSGGLLEETSRELLSKGLGPNINCATRAIGYRQALEYLDIILNNTRDDDCEYGDKDKEDVSKIAKHSAVSSITEAGIIQLAKDIQTASRKLCHRQLSWFRDDPLFRWIDAAQGQESALAEILQLWDEPAHQGGCAAFNGGRLTKEQEKQMKQYVTKFGKLLQGTEAMEKAIKEANVAVEKAIEAGIVGATNGVEEEPLSKRSKS